jgi:hypothetical protein
MIAPSGRDNDKMGAIMAPSTKTYTLETIQAFPDELEFADINFGEVGKAFVGELPYIGDYQIDGIPLLQPSGGGTTVGIAIAHPRNAGRYHEKGVWDDPHELIGCLVGDVLPAWNAACKLRWLAWASQFKSEDGLLRFPTTGLIPELYIRDTKESAMTQDGAVGDLRYLNFTCQGGVAAGQGSRLVLAAASRYRGFEDEVPAWGVASIGSGRLRLSLAGQPIARG